MTKPILQRLWIYQSERFPLGKTIPLLAVFSAASICVSAELSERTLPHWSGFLIGFILALTIFFQMRVCDEYKDLEDDKTYRPERPIPRGLVTLEEVILLGLFTIPIALLSAWAWHITVLYLLGLTWLWLAFMTIEFGAPVWLKSKPILYLISHMAIMPIIDLLLTSVEWGPNSNPSPHLWVFLLLSFVNGCVLEIGRKLWAPENEIEGVDTYSALWGVKNASYIWIVSIFASLILLITLGAYTGNLVINVIIGVLGVGYCLLCVTSYMNAPTLKNQNRMDTIAGLWVFLCYSVAGFVPLLLG